MKMIMAYIRTECSADVMRDLYNAGVAGITFPWCMEYGVTGRRFFIRRDHSKFIICQHR